MKEKKLLNMSAGAYVKAYAPFLLVAVIGGLYHIRMQPMGGDDVFFLEATQNVSLWDYLSHRYLHWTSRVVSELLLVNVIQVIPLWRMLDFLMFASFPVLFAKLFDDSVLMRWCGAGAVLLFPFHDMGTAGWVTTTVTHFWPLWGIFYVALLLKRLMTEARVHPVWGILGVPVAIMTGSHEQYAVILLVLLIICGICLWRQRSVAPQGKRPVCQPLFVVLVLITLLSLAVIACCPGNAGRNAVSLADLPIYETFGFGDKLYLGLLSIERVFIANADAVFFAVVFIWTLLVYLKTGNYKKTILSGAPLLILFGQTVLRTAYPGLSGLFVMPEQVLEWSWEERGTWIPMVYLAVSVAAMLYALYQLFGENLFVYISVLVLLGCGFGAGMVLGFMATIYVSGERVYAPLYAILLAVTLFAIYRQREAVGLRIRQTSGRLVLTVLGLLCLVNVLFIALSV